MQLSLKPAPGEPRRSVEPSKDVVLHKSRNFEICSCSCKLLDGQASDNGFSGCNCERKSDFENSEDERTTRIALTGMNDLLSLFIILFEDNADAFWCFEMLRRMVYYVFVCKMDLHDLCFVVFKVWLFLASAAAFSNIGFCLGPPSLFGFGQLPPPRHSPQESVRYAMVKTSGRDRITRPFQNSNARLRSVSLALKIQTSSRSR
ncbi:hypothetical protein L1987_27583 [Smallanthus sonchifolius]|uniref:Uncharacterized protein n=1 Tax=Smallanthus sonchifolius TaxID=185202 RepID=A0ACB9IBD5_9ASTR|nr:hypothetical protein L1987_27583 [Smallanthus sonchifolius]